ncbi:hypothetical protein HMPREF0454_00501 [Hafnia alvei ATCC 51873]|uniref:Uncharacterized protein n=1 Tax=Hafnia alvei ATCC 51873 TaxID=1002364 RepID=G9Y1T4_HAFAL|nr:hypothetical protein HMPREF0454_00501 [Hafnia alvei ATCC 51873]
MDAYQIRVIKAYSHSNHLRLYAVPEPERQIHPFLLFIRIFASDKKYEP